MNGTHVSPLPSVGKVLQLFQRLEKYLPYIVTTDSPRFPRELQFSVSKTVLSKPSPLTPSTVEGRKEEISKTSLSFLSR